MIWLAGVAFAAPWFRPERVDLISEDAPFLVEELPRIGVAPRSVAIRWLEQVRFVMASPRMKLVFGASVASQHVAHRFRIHPRARIWGSAGLTTRLFLPRGVLLGVETWAGPVRLGLGLHVASDASWARPRWNHWTATPGLGIGIGRRPTVF